MGINTVGGCDCRCATCENCCGNNGTDPAEYEVEILWTDDTCGACDGATMSATYVLPKVYYGVCDWNYVGMLFSGPNCGSYYLIATRLLLTIRCSGGNYVVTLTVSNEYRDYSNPYSGGCDALIPYGYFTNLHTWSKTIVAADYTCDTDSLVLDYVGRECWCGTWALPYSPCYTDVADCVAPATVTIVPVP